MNITVNNTVYKFKACYAGLLSLFDGSGLTNELIPDEISYSVILSQLAASTSVNINAGLLVPLCDDYKQLDTVCKIGAVLLLNDSAFIPAVIKQLLNDIQLDISDSCQHDYHECPNCNNPMDSCCELLYCAVCKQQTVAVGSSPSEFTHRSVGGGGDERLTTNQLYCIGNVLANYTGCENVMYDIAMEYGPANRDSGAVNAVKLALAAKK